MAASAEDKAAITVRSGGSGDPGLNFVAAAFQKATGHAVRITYDNEIQSNDQVFDVVVASSDVLDRELRPAGHVEAGGIVIGRNAGLAVTVRADAFVPRIASLEEFRRALLETDAFLTTTHTSGLYVEAKLQEMGVYEAVQARIERFANGPVLMDRLLSGKGKEFAILSVNQIRRYEDKGLIIVGPVPDELQYAIEFVAVPMAASVHKEIAWDFARFCAGPGRPLLVANGFS